MSIQAATSTALQTQGYLRGKSRGATIMYGGSAATTGWLNVVSNVVGGSIAGYGRKPDPKCPDPEVYTSTNTRTLRALGTGKGDWGVVRPGKYIVLGGNITTVLANYTARPYYGLVAGASDNGSRKSIYARNGGNSIKPRLFSLTLTYSGGTYPYPTLAVTYTTAVSSDFGEWNIAKNQAGDATADKAVNVTRALPGRICYSINGKVPTITDYLTDTD